MDLQLGTHSDTLKKIEMPIVDLQTCMDKAPSDYKVFVNSDKICAG